MLVEISVKVVLEISFLTFGNTDTQFDKRSFTWRAYTIADALPTMRRVELIGNQKFVKAALENNSKIFVIHVSAVEVLKLAMLIYPSQAPCQQDLLYVSEIIRIEFISSCNYNLLASCFDIEKTKELINQQYDLPIHGADDECYMRGCVMCLASKLVKHKLYGNLQFFSVLIY